ncbi:MAG: hypothetical protein ACREP7_16315 [Lysobacter sp.]
MILINQNVNVTCGTLLRASVCNVFIAKVPASGAGHRCGDAAWRGVNECIDNAFDAVGKMSAAPRAYGKDSSSGHDDAEGVPGISATFERQCDRVAA